MMDTFGPAGRCGRRSRPRPAAVLDQVVSVLRERLAETTSADLAVRERPREGAYACWLPPIPPRDGMRRTAADLRWQGEDRHRLREGGDQDRSPTAAPGSTPDYTRAAVQKGATGPGRNAKPPGFPGVFCYFLHFDGDIFRGRLPAGGIGHAPHGPHGKGREGISASLIMGEPIPSRPVRPVASHGPLWSFERQLVTNGAHPRCEAQQTLQ
jgi:hypothetical protein